jgi:hypothetical protein
MRNLERRPFVVAGVAMIRPVLAVFAALGLAALAACAGSAPATSFGEDPRLVACAAGVASGNPVQAAFAMDHASDFSQHFPSAGQAPELLDETPAFVVILDAPVNLGLTGAPGSSSSSAPNSPFQVNAVCVDVGGTVNFYADVDLTGFRP